MIKVIPSIFLREGKVVRTKGSDINEFVTYERDPIDLSMEFADNGFSRLHVVDLDGASRRKIVHHEVLELIVKYSKLEVNFSGGITTDAGVRTAFECGAHSVTVATAAITDPDRFYSWFITYGGPEKIILAADSLDGQVLYKGWKGDSGIDLKAHVKHFYERGIYYVKATEIGRNGTLEGPAFELYQDLRQTFPDLKIIASGGVRSLEDVEQLDALGVHSVILGKSLYDGIISYSQLQKYNETSPAV
ncbi:HisA/HisF-related TIM barrel protein [Eisenibacter elegans]|jgi:phosphoribosylformimino-5-aminoimidazole carboxamide ribotide isomerase|uniref:1-(5-phosphoribosyl)-5-[(5- phosphoribosylamino)methylideneamino]imidazole-4- carboxamide isomerase n=1 Tax=Eisenibacter elegans TaxID=997 RepID=UPI0004047D14|nr:1-(5-phosphoribosyl)-5-[(5-phosphoribosylamino)methylideneamino] imidazole-4-carboxamide isomerase [Eisenibacter elegans]